MRPKQSIDFSHNWNNKLQCSVFTTLRLSGRFQVGDIVEIYLNNRKTGEGEVLIKRQTTLGGITDGVAFIDTGYNAQECRKILQTMYKNTPLTNETPVYLYFIRRIAQDAGTQQHLFT